MVKKLKQLVGQARLTFLSSPRFVAAMLSPSSDMQTEETALSLSFELAKEDSPTFRANLQRFEDEVEKLSLWLESLCKSTKFFTDELGRAYRY